MITRYYGKKDRHKRHRIEVYDGWFDVVVCHSIEKARNCPSMVRWLKSRCTNCNGAAGLSDEYRYKIAVFFDRVDLGHDVIAHEIFHATHRLLDYAGVKHDEDHHEAHAHLCGSLTRLVYQDLKLWGERIKP